MLYNFNGLLIGVIIWYSVLWPVCNWKEFGLGFIMVQNDIVSKDIDSPVNLVQEISKPNINYT